MMPSAVASGTVTQSKQRKVETDVFRIYQLFRSLPGNTQSLMLELERDNHIEYLTTSLRQKLPTSLSDFDPQRPWICYWILHSLALLGKSVDAQLKTNTIDFLSRRCQTLTGGYGGGPGQMPHLATTYAAVNALITLGGHRALSSINRSELYMFLRRMKHPSGGFRMHDGGEIDIRASYCAISVASILNILDDELAHNVGSYILSCQTYEGGISGEPGSEAHVHLLWCGNNDADQRGQSFGLSQKDWLVVRQGKEYGFNGSTNKLVDGCYSFWQGGVFALLQRLSSIISEQLVLPQPCKTSSVSDPSNSSESTSSQVDETCRSWQGVNFNDIGHSFVKKSVGMEPLSHGLGLQLYILLCSQEKEGGLKDKPGKPRDWYHTCYCLSGLSVCQNILSDDSLLPKPVLGPYSNLLEPIHPVFNVVLERYDEAREFFSRD